MHHRTAPTSRQRTAATRRPPPLRALCLWLAAATAPAAAHVTLPPGGATAGTVYPAAFHVGHACEGAEATTALRVRLPAGFVPTQVPARPGWRIEQSPGEVRWTAESPQDALPAKARTRFVVHGRLTDQPGTLWFQVLQVCDRGSADWSQVPAAAGDKPAFPPARLDVLPPGQAPVEVREPWARATVAGQGTTAVYAQLTAGAGATLVAARSPLAGTVAVHEMTMDGHVMRMRELPQGLALPPGERVALSPGGLHLMVQDLRQPLADGSVLPLVLRFVDRDGRPSERSVDVPVRQAAPGSADPHAKH